MRKSILQTSTFALLFMLFFLGLNAFRTKNNEKKHYRHAVTITFKQGTTDAQIATEISRLKGLAKLKWFVPTNGGIVDDAKDKNRVKHIYIFTFDDKKDLAAYGESPEHQAHIKIGADYIEGGSAVQFFVQD